MSTLTFTAYQLEAARTMGTEPDKNKLLAIMGLGLAGESGEVVELIKKHVGHGHALTKSGLEKELGDVFWYLAAIATMNNIDLNEVAWGNINKLRARYPNGFNSADSQKRVDVAPEQHGPIELSSFTEPRR